MHDYDRSSKWLIQHHGGAILRLAGVSGIVRWKALQSEVVQPRALPDSLIAATLAGESDPRIFVLEMATYPEPRVVEQAIRDAALVYLDRGELPEVVVVVLSPKGRYRVPREAEVVSGWGRTIWNLRWHVVELWTIPAEDLLAVPEVGAVPWALLGHIDGPPEPFFRRCRERIDLEAPADEHENLLAVSQILARLRYDDERLFRLLGGEQAMLELPFLDKFKEKWVREATHENQVRNIVDFLTARFGSRASSLRSKLAAIDDEAKLSELVKVAAVCESLKDFRTHLPTPSGPGKKS
ncbi:hypothetical protein [Aquisphaera insulae]|uniref:hypothetical protein n=1 Tax=Aquisphaera insulae TaxID=2712864 RepID=UPI0013ED269A|nr:hypothetical protein [Aquisphaera insulae]